MRTFSPRRTTALAIGALALTSVVGGITAPSASAADKVIVFYTQCDKLSATDTVKVKRVDEDGKNAVTIGDTGIKHCAAGGPSTEYLSGFAVSGAYGYFSWAKSDASTIAIGRIRLDGTGSVEPTFITIPSPANTIQMSPRAVNGYLFFYLDDGYYTPPGGSYATGVNNARIVKARVSDGQLTTVYQPEPTGATDRILRMSFGVGKDALYVATNDSNDQQLDRVTFDGTVTRNVFNFATAPNIADRNVKFLVGVGANLVAESNDTMFLYSMRADDGKFGISTYQTTSPTDSLQVFKAVPGNEGQQPANFQVWGGNYLYYQDVTGLKIGRTT